MSTRRSLQIQVQSAQGLPEKSLGKHSCHCVITLDGRTRETLVVKNQDSPSWHHILDFEFEPKELVEEMTATAEVVDNGLLGKSVIGSGSLVLAGYVDGQTHKVDIPLTHGKDKPSGTLSVQVTLQDVAKPPKSPRG